MGVTMKQAKILTDHIRELLITGSHKKDIKWHNTDEGTFAIRWPRVQKTSQPCFIYEFYKDLKIQKGGISDFSHVKRNFRAALASYVSKKKLLRRKDLETNDKNFRYYQFTNRDKEETYLETPLYSPGLLELGILSPEDCEDSLFEMGIESNAFDLNDLTDFVSDLLPNN